MLLLFYVVLFLYTFGFLCGHVFLLIT